MNDVEEFAVVIQDRRIDGAPISRFEGAALARGPADIVLLDIVSGCFFCSTRFKEAAREVNCMLLKTWLPFQ
jgi:hypothetical protein